MLFEVAMKFPMKDGLRFQRMLHWKVKVSLKVSLTIESSDEGSLGSAKYQ